MFTTGTRHRSSCLLGHIPWKGRCHQIIPSPYGFVSSVSGHTRSVYQRPLHPFNAQRDVADFVLETSPRCSVTCHFLFLFAIPIQKSERCHYLYGYFSPIRCNRQQKGNLLYLTSVLTVCNFQHN